MAPSAVAARQHATAGRTGSGREGQGAGSEALAPVIPLRPAPALAPASSRPVRALRGPVGPVPDGPASDGPASDGPLSARPVAARAVSVRRVSALSLSALSAPPRGAVRPGPVRSRPERIVERRRPVSGAPARRPVSAARYRVRRAVAVVVVALGALAVVVGLGLIADAAGVAAANSTVPAGTRIIVTGPSETAWDVARRVAPGADAAAVVERIVADNGLGSVALEPGRTLRVPA